MQLRLGILCLWISLAVPAGAATIFNNLTNNGTIPASLSGAFAGFQVQGVNFGGPNLITGEFAAQFLPSQDFDVTSFVVPINNNGGPGNSSVVLRVFTDSGGLPGSQVGVQSWSFTGGNNLTVLTTVAVSGLHLMGGTAYWLVASPGSPNTTTLWSLNTLIPSFQGPHAANNQPVQGWTLLNGPSNAFDPAFAILGDATPSAAPEPLTFVLTAAGLSLLRFVRRS